MAESVMIKDILMDDGGESKKIEVTGESEVSVLWFGCCGAGVCRAFGCGGINKGDM